MFLSVTTSAFSAANQLRQRRVSALQAGYVQLPAPQHPFQDPPARLVGIHHQNPGARGISVELLGSELTKPLALFRIVP